MKILHIWNTAGCGSLLARKMDKKFGTKSLILTREIDNKFCHAIYNTKVYKDGPLFIRSISFVLICLFKARKFDIIHIHSDGRMLFILKKFYPHKPMIMCYHGTDIRKKWEEKKWQWKWANQIFVSTEDLLEGAPKGVKHLPRMVPTDKFFPRSSAETSKAIHISYGATDLAIEYAEKKELKLTIHDRNKKPLSYIEMPKILNKFSWYIDVKRDANGHILHAISRTGLEALACGLKVIRWDGKVIQGLPEVNKPENIVDIVYDYYSKLMK